MLCEVIGLLLPNNIPYGLVIVIRLAAVLIGSIIAIARLKNKHKLISFGKSLKVGVSIIVISFIISIIIYELFHASNYRYTFEGAIALFGAFTLAQIGILLLVLITAGMWYAYTKAGEKGYAIFIPIYNVIVMLKIAKKPMWWFFMLLIPIVNIAFFITILNGVSKSFGKTEGFTAGLIFFGGVFWAILGYGEAKYTVTTE
jgi:hypothetical protein